MSKDYDPRQMREAFEVMEKTTKAGTRVAIETTKAAAELGVSGGKAVANGLLKLFGHLFGPK